VRGDGAAIGEGGAGPQLEVPLLLIRAGSPRRRQRRYRPYAGVVDGKRAEQLAGEQQLLDGAGLGRIERGWTGQADAQCAAARRPLRHGGVLLALAGRKQERAQANDDGPKRGDRKAPSQTTW